MKETTYTMKDFNLGSSLGQIKNKEDRRVYIEKANAKASLTIKACKNAKKLAPVNRDVEEYVEKVREAIKNDAIPADVTLDMYKQRIRVMEERRDKMLKLKDKQKGFLAKSDVRKLEQWEEAIKQISFERDDFLEQHKNKNKVKEQGNVNSDKKGSADTSGN